MDINDLCLSCIREKGGKDKCPYCGYNNNTPPELPQYLNPGTILNGKFMVGRALGHGGFGVTYIGMDLNLDIKVAIKEYLPQALATRTQNETGLAVYSGEKHVQYKNGIKKFLDEAKTVAKFNHHSNIVTVRDFFTENNTAYMVMDYIEGVDLKDYVKNTGRPLAFNDALSLLNPIIDALGTVHNAGLLHRDISPDNIFITNEGTPILLDFGAARQYLNQDNGLSVILKSGYAPEEQYRRNGNSGPWSDLYAFAATLYHVITGRKPMDSLDRMESDELQPPSALGVEIPAQAEAALMKALAVKGANRFQSMEDFQQAINFQNDGFATVPKKTKGKQFDWGDANSVAASNIKSNRGKSQRYQKQSFGKPVKKNNVLVGVLIGAGSLVGILIVAVILIVLNQNNSQNTETFVETKPTQQVIEQVTETTSEVAPEQTNESAGLPAAQTGDSETMILNNAPVNFIDSAFGESVGLALNKPVSEITQSDLESIELLEIWGNDFASINDEDSGIDFCGESGYSIDGLEYVEHGAIKRLDDLAMFPNLTAIIIGYNSIANIDGIANAANLQLAYLAYNEVTDVSPIYDSATMEVLIVESFEGLVNYDLSNETKQVIENPFLLFNASRYHDRLTTGPGHTLGIKKDGSVISQGTITNNGKTEVADWEDIVMVAAGEDHSVGLKSDGTCVAVGSNKTFGQCNVNSWVDIVYIAANGSYTVGVKADGTCEAVGLNDEGQCDVQDWTNIVMVACGEKHTLGLKNDGSVVATGNNASGRCNVQDWENIVFIAAGTKHSLGITERGTVVGTGWNDKFQLDGINKWEEVVSIAAGTNYSVAVTAKGKMYLAGSLSQRIPKEKNARYVFGSNDSAIILKQDGTFEGFGANSFGKNNIYDWQGLIFE